MRSPATPSRRSGALRVYKTSQPTAPSGNGGACGTSPATVSPHQAASRSAVSTASRSPSAAGNHGPRRSGDTRRTHCSAMRGARGAHRHHNERVSGSESTVVPPSAGAALSSYRRHSWAFFGVGAASCALGYAALWIAGFPDDGPASTVAIGLFGLGIVPVLVGLGSLVQSLRMAACMRRYPWRTLQVRQSLDSWGGNPILALGPDGEHALFLKAIKQRWAYFVVLDHVLFAGRPDRNGVVATPDGRRLIWARRPRGGWHRRWLARKVLRLNGRDLARTVDGAK